MVVESDKADMDVETFYDGYLACIVVEEGEVAPVGAAIGLLAETEAEIAEAKAKGQGGSTAATPSAPSPVEAAAVAPPAAPTTPSPVAAVQIAPAPAVVEEAGEKRIIATPYAKKLAKQFKLNLATVTGSGPNGRITGTDVEMAAGKPVSATPLQIQPTAVATSAPAAAKAAAPAATPTAAPAGSVAFTSMQAGVARNMVESMSVPTFRVGYTITTDALDALYKKVGRMIHTQ